MARKIGFDKVEPTDRLFKWDSKLAKRWAALVALTAHPPEESDQAEQGIGNDQVKLYPVRTPLSRHLTGDSDCVIHILPPLEEAAAAVTLRMQRYLAESNLKGRNRVQFWIHATRLETLEIYRERYTGKPVFRDLLGFQHDSCRLTNPPQLASDESQRKDGN